MYIKSLYRLPSPWLPSTITRTSPGFDIYFNYTKSKGLVVFFKSTYICKVLIQYRFVHVYTTYTLYIAFTSLAQELEMKNKKRKTIISTLSNITIICKVAYRITFLWNLIIIKV